MNLQALHSISGVTVLRGKGKGTNTAHPGDIFTSDSGERLVAEGAAIIEGESAGSTDATHRGPDVVAGEPTVESVAERSEPAAPAPAEKSAKPETAKQKAAREKKVAESAKKAAEASAESVDDLGLGDDSGEEEVVE